jgi:hypothetical protein
MGALSSETLFLGVIRRVIRRDIESFLLLFVNILELFLKRGSLVVKL